MTKRNEMNDDFVRVIAPLEWFDTKPTRDVWYAVPPLLAGVQLKYQSPNWRLCSRLAHNEYAECSLAGVAHILAGEYWAWKEQWVAFAHQVAESVDVQRHILSLTSVYGETVSLQRLEQARSIVRSVAAAQACALSLEGIR